MLPLAPVSSLAVSVVFLLSLCARFTWKDADTSSRLDSGVPCVKFSMMTRTKTMDLKDVSAAEFFESSITWIHCLGPWINRLLRSALISYSTGMSGHVLGIWLRCEGNHSSCKFTSPGRPERWIYLIRWFWCWDPVSLSLGFVSVLSVWAHLRFQLPWLWAGLERIPVTSQFP